MSVHQERIATRDWEVADEVIEWATIGAIKGTPDRLSAAETIAEYRRELLQTATDPAAIAALVLNTPGLVDTLADSIAAKMYGLKNAPKPIVDAAQDQLRDSVKRTLVELAEGRVIDSKGVPVRIE